MKYSKILQTVEEFKGGNKFKRIENPNEELYAASLPERIIHVLNLLHGKVTITRKALKHIVNSREINKADVEYIVSAIPEILRNPTKIVDNSAKTPSHFRSPHPKRLLLKNERYSWEDGRSSISELNLRPGSSLSALQEYLHKNHTRHTINTQKKNYQMYTSFFDTGQIYSRVFCAGANNNKLLFEEQIVILVVIMIIFKRAIEARIISSLFKKRMVSILGPRQSGKTTLAKKIMKGYGKNAAYYDCQLAEIRKHFTVGKPDELLPLTKGKKIVVFDEAQTIQDIGTILKVFHDRHPGVQIIATGSSSFDLANKINEPMTGRIFEFTLLPLSLSEISMSKHITSRDLHQYMLYGTYPAVVGENSLDLKKTILKNIATQYLYKDVFTFEAIRNPRVFEDLLKLLALQIGSLVSLNELATQLGVSRSVIQKYLRLLEQSFIVKIVHSFSNNPRTELKKAFKVFFLDVGVRNALVDIASPMDTRADKGAIFENFFIAERIKTGTLEIFTPEIMFWRTRIGQEIDVIEKRGIEIFAYECKWKEKTSVPVAFKNAYPKAHFESITTENILALYGGQTRPTTPNSSSSVS